jgi:hypothetical protein
MFSAPSFFHNDEARKEKADIRSASENNQIFKQEE